MNDLNKKVDLLCFVIMPGGSREEYEGGAKESKYIFKHIIGKAINKFEDLIDKSIHVTLETDKKAPGSITKSIIGNIAKSDICIVDITGLNPNVFFELGIRYALREKITILLRQDKTSIPFDIHGYKCINYDRFEPDIAIDNIVEFLKSGFDDKNGIDSLVFETFKNLEVSIPGILSGKGSLFKENITWGEWWKQVEDLILLLKDSIVPKFLPDFMLGISNGGLMVADLIGRQCFHGKPILSLWADRWDNKEGTNFPLFESSFNEATIQSMREHFANSPDRKIRILLVDDIVKSSTTCFQAKNYLEERFNGKLELLFVPLYCKKIEFLNDAESILPYGFKDGFFRIDKEKFLKKIKTDKKFFPYKKSLEI